MSKIKLLKCPHLGKDGKCSNPFRLNPSVDEHKQKFFQQQLDNINPNDVLHFCGHCCITCKFAKLDAPENETCNQMFFDCPLYIISSEFKKRNKKDDKCKSTKSKSES